MMRIVRNILLGLIAIAAFVYAVDDLYARIRHQPGADVHIDRYLAVEQKFNKIDYERTDPITERCVYTLLPHFGHNPCWYVTRHTLRFIKVG
jgi:hypothetical protein